MAGLLLSGFGIYDAEISLDSAFFNTPAHRLTGFGHVCAIIIEKGVSFEQFSLQMCLFSFFRFWRVFEDEISY